MNNNSQHNLMSATKATQPNINYYQHNLTSIALTYLRQFTQVLQSECLFESFDQQVSDPPVDSLRHKVHIRLQVASILQVCWWPQSTAFLKECISLKISWLFRDTGRQKNINSSSTTCALPKDVYVHGSPQRAWLNSINDIPSCHHHKPYSIIFLVFRLPLLLLIFSVITMFLNAIFNLTD